MGDPAIDIRALEKRFGAVEALRGLTFTVVFPRQAGKNELSAHLEAFLLHHYQRQGGSIVKAAPTFRPQVVNSILRLEQLLGEPLTDARWRRVQGFIFRLGRASCSFYSARPTANVVGASASLLLEGDEAQDLDRQKWADGSRNTLFGDVNVRRAFAYALDKDSIVKTATAGHGTPLWGDLVPAQAYYDANAVVKYTQDIAKAQSLIAAAGWTKGSDGILQKNGQKFSAKFYVRAGKPQRIQAVTIMSEELWIWLVLLS